MAQSSGVGEIIKWGAIAGLAYWAYTTFFAAPAAGVTTSPPAAKPATTDKTGTAPVVNSLDAIYQKLQTAWGSGTHNADEGNWYLVSVGGIDVAPAPESFIPGFVRTTTGPQYTAAQYWAYMAPWLRTNKGLSGLGAFAGLGALYGWGR
jgi:hypothetical protein